VTGRRSRRRQLSARDRRRAIRVRALARERSHAAIDSRRRPLCGSASSTSSDSSRNVVGGEPQKYVVRDTARNAARPDRRITNGLSPTSRSRRRLAAGERRRTFPPRRGHVARAGYGQAASGERRSSAAPRRPRRMSRNDPRGGRVMRRSNRPGGTSREPLPEKRTATESDLAARSCLPAAHAGLHHTRPACSSSKRRLYAARDVRQAFHSSGARTSRRSAARQPITFSGPGIASGRDVDRVREVR